MANFPSPVPSPPHLHPFPRHHLSFIMADMATPVHTAQPFHSFFVPSIHFAKSFERTNARFFGWNFTDESHQTLQVWSQRRWRRRQHQQQLQWCHTAAAAAEHKMSKCFGNGISFILPRCYRWWRCHFAMAARKQCSMCREQSHNVCVPPKTMRTRRIMAKERRFPSHTHTHGAQYRRWIAISCIWNTFAFCWRSIWVMMVSHRKMPTFFGCCESSSTDPVNALCAHQ